MNYNLSLIILAFSVFLVSCEESSEEEKQQGPSNQRIFNNGQPLTLPQFLQIPQFNSGYSPTTISPLLFGQTLSGNGLYNPTTVSPLAIQTQQGNEYNPTTTSPLFIQQAQPQGQQPVQVIQIPTQTQRPNTIYLQTQPQSTAQPQVVVIPNKRPKPSKPHKHPIAPTAQPPIYIQTQPQYQSQTPVQVIQVTGKPTYKPTTARPPILIQTQQQQPSQNPFHVIQVTGKPPTATVQPPVLIQTQPQQSFQKPVHVDNVPSQQFEPQQETYQIHPGLLDNPTDYEFNWYVNNIESGDYKSHREIRQNDIVQGQYEVLDPDGFRRIVSYSADEVHGFRAVVRRIPLNSEIISNSHRPTYDTVNYFGGPTTQRPFKPRTRKPTLATVPVENTLNESNDSDSNK